MTLADRTVFVTGATGFLGRALTRRLVAGGARVRALARSADKARRLPPECDVVHGDITDAARMTELVAGCSLVIHAAAAMGGSISLQRDTNVAGTANVLEAATAAGVGRAVHVSTIAAYGFGAATYPEDTELAPSDHAYSTTKAEGERAAREIAARRGLEIAIIRPAGIFGPEAGYWTGAYFKRVRRRPIAFVGSGRGTLPVIFVDDVVDLCLVAATHAGAADEAFNCVLDPSPTVREYHHAYGRLVGNESWLGAPTGLLRGATRLAAPFAPRHTYLKEAPLMLDYLERTKRYPMDKARAHLDWQPRYDLEAGVAACVPWLQEVGLLAPGRYPAGSR